MVNPFSLEGKNIVITGASSGIGRQVAISCSYFGANLIIVGRNSKRLNETHNLLKKTNNHISCTIDITNFGSVQHTIEPAVEKFGKIDGIVHSAGVTTTKPFKMFKSADMEFFIKTNVTAALNLTRICLKPKLLNESGASFVFISSIMSIVGEMGKTLYSASKGALTSSVRCLALEYANKNIRANSILPGVVITPMSEKSFFSQDQEAKKKIESLHPLGLGKPDDVANTCIFLLSDASRWITGTSIVVDGGYTTR